VERAVLIEDLYLQIRVIVWSLPSDPNPIERIESRFAEALGPFWSGDFIVANNAPEPDREVYESVWKRAKDIGNNLRLSERIRSHGYWLETPTEPIWPLPDETSDPPVIAFYSFKGGVGRTTALSSFAISTVS